MEIGTNELQFDSPKHLSLQIAEILERKIVNKELPVGQKLPSQDDLFKMFNVSLGTMKEALSILTKEGYISRRRKYGTFVISDEPRKGMYLKRKDAIAFIMYSTSDPIYKILYHDLTNGAEEKARVHKLNMIYRNMNDNGVIDFGSLENDIAGLIVAGMITKEGIRNVRNTKMPFVLIGDPLEKEKADEIFDVVGNDDYQRAYLATKHLVELGHKRILYINKSIDRFSWEIEMFRAYKEALKEGDVDYDDKLILELETFDNIGTYKAMTDFLKKSIEFTAVVCMSPGIYLGTAKIFGEKNTKVPDDVSIVVCGDAPPEITTVDYELKDLGRAAVELLYQKVTTPDWKPKRVLIPNKLLIANSTRRISQ